MSAPPPVRTPRPPGRRRAAPPAAAQAAARTAADPRRLALDVLGRVLGERRPFDESFAGHPRLRALAPRDRAFARLLVTTVLRRLGQLDDLLGRLLHQPPGTEQVRNLLRLGAAQLLWLGTPAHAAVGETVACAKAVRPAAAGLLNAVLRRVATEGDALVADQDELRLNLPDWLWQSWCDTYGEPAARAIVAASLAEPPLDLTVKAERALWAETLAAQPLGQASLRRAGGGAIDALPGYAEGAFWVQDLAAALPAQLLGEVAGRRVLDLCAAPGGKTLQLAAAGAAVTAVEISAKRAERLAANLARCQLSAKIVVADALSFEPLVPFDRILLDAPCTATGTIRRHPDIVWLKRPEDVQQMAELQARLLRHALGLLPPGGVLVYASCSLQPAEGLAQIEAALAGPAGIERLPIQAAELAGLPLAPTAAGDLRSLPSDLAELGGMDGFFISRLRRIA